MADLSGIPLGDAAQASWERERAEIFQSLDAAGVASWIVDLKSNLAYCSAHLRFLFGLPDDAPTWAPAEWYVEAVHPEDRAAIYEELGGAAAQGANFAVEFRVTGSDGQERWVLSRGSTARDAVGAPDRVTGAVIDITDRRRAEEALRASERQRQLAVESAEIGAWNIDIATMRLDSDLRFRRIFSGTDRPLEYEEAFGIIHPDDRDLVRRAVDAACDPQNPVPYATEYRVVHPDGSLHWLSAKGRASFALEGREARAVSLDGTVIDITDRRRAEDAVYASEAHYRTLFESIDDAFCTYEMIFDDAGRAVDYRFLEFNEAFVAQTGLSREYALGGKTIREMVPNHEQKWFDLYGRVARTGEPVRVADRAEALGRDYEIHAFRIGGEGSLEVGAIFKDVTDRVETERALVEERERQDKTLENAEVATFDWDAVNDRVYANPLLARFFGVSEAEARGGSIERYFAAIHKEDREATTKAIGASLASGVRYEVQYRVTGEDGRERWVLARGDATLNAEGRPLRLSGVVLDITGRVVSERALVAERERFDAVLRLSPTFVTILRGDELLFEYANPAYLRLVGHRPTVGLTLDEAQPEVVEGGALGQRFDTILREVMASGEPRHFKRIPVRFQPTPDVPIDDRVLDFVYQPLPDAEGRITGIFAQGMDVTDQARAESERERLTTELAEERHRLDETLKTAGVATYDWDVRNDRLRGNDLFAEFFAVPNRPEGNPLGRYFESMHPDDRERIGGEVQRALATGARYEMRYRIRGVGGRERSILARGEAEVDRDGTPVRLFGVILDETERIQAEGARRESERQVHDALTLLQGIAEGTRELIVSIDPEYRFTSLNEAYRMDFQRVFGKIPRIGESLLDQLAHLPEDRDRAKAMFDRALGGENVEFTAEFGTDGERSAFDLRFYPVRDVEGRIVGAAEIARDVTDQVRSRRAIAEREELFRTVFEQAPDDAILVMDGDRTLTAWNPAAERITGWNADEVIGQPADLIFTPEERAQGAPANETSIAARVGKAADEKWHMRRDGSRFWGSGTMNSLHDAEGNVRGYLKVFRDATARYEETQTLAFLRTLTDVVIDLREPEGIVEVTERMLGQHLGVNRSIYGDIDGESDAFTVRQDWTQGVGSLVGEHRLSTFGNRIATNVLAGLTDIVRDREREPNLADGLPALRAGEAGGAITVPVRKDGRTVGIYAVNTKEPRNWTENEIGLVQQVADRMFAEVERARAEVALRASEERFRAAQDTTPDPFTIIEAVRDDSGEVVDFRWVYVNRATQSLTGETEAEQLGASVSEKRPGIRGSALWNGWLRTLETGEPFVTEQFMDFPGGRSFLRITCVKVGDGIGSAFLDLTQRQLNVERLEEAVSDRTTQLQAAVKEAEGFNYSISHDLRTPLRAIAATSSILLEEAGSALDEVHRDLLIRQKENAGRLGRLIDELLRLSRLARAEVRREPLDMTAKARRVFEDLEEQDKTNGCVLDAQEGMTAQGDAGLVRTVMHNFLGNACKFSPNGGTIRVRQVENVFSVSDEGVGFDMAFAPKVFLPFERLVSDTEFEGTGIGLANVERIVRRHGGRVWAESEPGKGATFFFTLEGDSHP